MDYDYTTRKRGVLVVKTDHSQSKADLSTATGISIDKISDETTHWFIETNGAINYQYQPSNLTTIPYRADIPTIAKVREHYKIADHITIEYDISTKIYKIPQSQIISEELEPQLSKTKQYYFVPHKSSYGNVETIKRDLKIIDTRVTGEKYGDGFWKLTIPKGLHVPDNGIPVLPAFANSDEIATTYSVNKSQITTSNYIIKDATADEIAGTTKTTTLPRLKISELKGLALLRQQYQEFIQQINHNVDFKNYIKALTYHAGSPNYEPVHSENWWNNRLHESMFCTLDTSPTAASHGFINYDTWNAYPTLASWQRFSQKFNKSVGMYIFPKCKDIIVDKLNHNQNITFANSDGGTSNGTYGKDGADVTYLNYYFAGKPRSDWSFIIFACTNYSVAYTYSTIDKKMIMQKITTDSDKQTSVAKSDDTLKKNNKLMILKAYGYLIGRFNNDLAFRDNIKSRLTSSHYVASVSGYFLDAGSKLSRPIRASWSTDTYREYEKASHDMTKSPINLHLPNLPVDVLGLWIEDRFANNLRSANAISSVWANPTDSDFKGFVYIQPNSSLIKPANDKSFKYGHQVFSRYNGAAFWTYANKFHERLAQAQYRLQHLNIKNSGTDLSDPWTVTHDTANGFTITYTQELENLDYIAKSFGVAKTDITANTDGSYQIPLNPKDETNDSMRQRSKPALDNLPNPSNSWIEIDELKL